MRHTVDSSLQRFGPVSSSCVPAVLLGPLVLSSLLLCAGAFPVFGEMEVVVTGDDVNLRAKPEAESEVVSQVSEGDILVAEGSPDQEWVRIVPPQEVDLWVYSELIRDGEIAVSKARVRAGPGINYSAVGFLEKEDKVTLRGSMGEWSRIAPPAGSFLYISGDYVKKFEKKDKKESIPEPEEKVTVERTPLVPVQTVVPQEEPVSEEPPPAVPRSPVPVTGKTRIPSVIPQERLVKTMKQGEVVRYEGTVRPAGFVWRRPGKFRLVRRDENGRGVTVCYVLGREEGLASIAGTAVVVSGREYWVQGVRAPVVVIDEISRP